MTLFEAMRPGFPATNPQAGLGIMAQPAALNCSAVLLLDVHRIDGYGRQAAGAIAGQRDDKDPGCKKMHNAGIVERGVAIAKVPDPIGTIRDTCFKQSRQGPRRLKTRN